jgi:probable F420-dependent oxidoreductase
VLLANSTRINVASGIANIYARDPMAMANGARALEDAWPGRFVLGLGVSHASSVERRGGSYGKPVDSMSSYLDAMEHAPWRGPDVEAPPIVLAALGPKMLSLAAKRAQGAFPYFVPVEHTVRARAALGEDAFLATEQAVIFASTREQARAIGEPHTAIYLRLPNYRNNLIRLGWTEEQLAQPPADALFDALIAWGDDEAIEARIEEHFKAGADQVVVQPLTAEPTRPYVDEVRRLGAILERIRR